MALLLLTRWLVALLPVLGLLPRAVVEAREVVALHRHVLAEVVAGLAGVVGDPSERNRGPSLVVPDQVSPVRRYGRLYARDPC